MDVTGEIDAFIREHGTPGASKEQQTRDALNVALAQSADAMRLLDTLRGELDGSFNDHDDYYRH